jgi:hypothetical protein
MMYEGKREASAVILKEKNRDHQKCAICMDGTE